MGEAVGAQILTLHPSLRHKTRVTTQPHEDHKAPRPHARANLVCPNKTEVLDNPSHNEGHTAPRHQTRISLDGPHSARRPIAQCRPPVSRHAPQRKIQPPQQTIQRAPPRHHGRPRLHRHAVPLKNLPPIHPPLRRPPIHLLPRTQIHPQPQSWTQSSCYGTSHLLPVDPVPPLRRVRASPDAGKIPDAAPGKGHHRQHLSHLPREQRSARGVEPQSQYRANLRPISNTLWPVRTRPRISVLLAAAAVRRPCGVRTALRARKTASSPGTKSSSTRDSFGVSAGRNRRGCGC
jgi:hypothetical protein